MRNFLHKSTFVLCFFMCLGWNGISICTAGAMDEGESQHISTGRILEFSLRNLKDSLQKTRQKNDRLSFENTALRKDIRNLKRMLEKLSRKKDKLLGKPTTLRYQEDQIALGEAFDVKERKMRVDELVAFFERDVLALQEDIRLLDNQLDQEKFKSEKQLLIDKKRESQESISKIEKRLKILDKKSMGPQRIIEELENEKSLLAQKLSVLEDRAAGY